MYRFSQDTREMNLVLKSGKSKSLVGLKAHQDGFKPAKFSIGTEFGNLREIEVSVKSVVQLKERLAVPQDYIPK